MASIKKLASATGNKKDLESFQEYDYIKSLRILIFFLKEMNLWSQFKRYVPSIEYDKHKWWEQSSPYRMIGRLNFSSHLLNNGDKRFSNCFISDLLKVYCFFLYPKNHFEIHYERMTYDFIKSETRFKPYDVYGHFSNALVFLNENGFIDKWYKLCEDYHNIKEKSGVSILRNEPRDVRKMTRPSLTLEY